MTWKQDGHGFVFKSNELKVYGPSHTYGMKLSQLHRQAGIVRILTYSLPDMAYVEEQLGRRPVQVMMLCHAKFTTRAAEIAKTFPNIALRVSDEMHSKVVLIEPSTMYIGSANFGSSGWHETVIGVRSLPALAWYVEHVFRPAWERAIPVGVHTDGR